MRDRFIIWLLGFVTHEHHLHGYMNRYWIFIKRAKTHIQIRLHHILRSDDDRALHDHPWWYLSIILKGGYWEVTKATLEQVFKHSVRLPNPETLYDPRYLIFQDDTWYYRKWYGPGSILFRRATHQHRLIIPAERTAWSLFICGTKSKDWGFITEKGWVKWDEYESAEEVAYHKAQDA